MSTYKMFKQNVGFNAEPVTGSSVKHFRQQLAKEIILQKGEIRARYVRASRQNYFSRQPHFTFSSFSGLRKMIFFYIFFGHVEKKTYWQTLWRESNYCPERQFNRTYQNQVEFTVLFDRKRNFFFFGEKFALLCEQLKRGHFYCGMPAHRIIFIPGDNELTSEFYQ